MYWRQLDKTHLSQPCSDRVPFPSGKGHISLPPSGEVCVEPPDPLGLLGHKRRLVVVGGLAAVALNLDWPSAGQKGQGEGGLQRVMRLKKEIHTIYTPGSSAPAAA